MKTDRKLLQEQQELASALKRLEQMKLDVCFDAKDVTSKATEQQIEVFKGINDTQFRYVIAGNQCFTGNSYVQMADGSSKPIKDVNVGEEIACFDVTTKQITTTKVVAKHVNENKEVWKYYFGIKTVECTAVHKFLNSKYEKIEISQTGEALLLSKDMTSFTPVNKTNRSYIGYETVYDLTVEHPDHNYICNNFLVSNSGKTALACREIAWIIKDIHPYWKRPEKWKGIPLMFIIAGQDRQNMEINIWKAKLKPFLEGQNWKETKSGGLLTRAENVDTGDQILFLSHNDSSDSARAHMQGYAANYVWVDEMPRNIKILDELEQRVAAKQGYFITTFTPLVRNAEIKQRVENATPPVARKFILHRLANPIYADRINEELAKMATLSEATRNTRLFGDWAPDEGSVYDFSDAMIEFPMDYSPLWRHVESVDPASKTTTGYTLWAEHPKTGMWYCVKSEYIKIQDPVALYAHVQALSDGHNIVRRISDPNSSWYMATATTAGCHPPYMYPNGKTAGRKMELIKGLQNALAKNLRISPNCDKIISEFQDCRWAENSDTPRIVNSSTFHLLDSAQYFVDLMPVFNGQVEPEMWYTVLNRQHREKMEKLDKQNEAKANYRHRSARISRYNPRTRNRYRG